MIIDTITGALIKIPNIIEIDHPTSIEIAVIFAILDYFLIKLIIKTIYLIKK